MIERRYIKHHTAYYGGLILVLVAGLFLITRSLHDLNLVMVVALFMSVFYVGWALLHHVIHHDMHVKVVVEYVLLGILGISVIYFALFLLK